MAAFSRKLENLRHVERISQTTASKNSGAHQALSSGELVNVWFRYMEQGEPSIIFWLSMSSMTSYGNRRCQPVEAADEAAACSARKAFMIS